MKKQIITLFTVFLAVCNTFVACVDTTNKKYGALKFDRIQVNETEHLFGDTAKPACNLIIDFEFAAKASDALLKDSVNSYLQAFCLGDKYTNYSPQEAIEKYVSTYVNDYRKDLEPMLQKDEQEQMEKASIQAWYSYYKNLKGEVKYYEKNLLVYQYYYEEYTGGAHGIYMTTFLNLDLETMTPIRLSDIFVEGYEEALTDLLWNQLMADNNVSTRQELEDLGYATTGNLEPTENFYISDEGLTFFYNVYDITPYAMGPVKITLPKEMVEYLLN